MHEQVRIPISQLTHDTVFRAPYVPVERQPQNLMSLESTSVLPKNTWLATIHEDDIEENSQRAIAFIVSSKRCDNIRLWPVLSWICHNAVA